MGAISSAEKTKSVKNFSGIEVEETHQRFDSV
jgi:hypothetical protein